MKFRLTRKYLLSIAVMVTFSPIFGGANVAHAQDCLSHQSTEIATAFNDGLHGWEAKNGFRLTSCAVTHLAEMACAVTSQMISVEGVPRSKVEAGLAPSVIDYLDHQVSPSKNGRSLGSAIRAQLGAQGLSRPEIKQFVQLKIYLKKSFDHVEINGELLAKSATFLVPPGQVTIQAIKGNSLVCKRVLTLTVGEVAIFNC